MSNALAGACDHAATLMQRPLWQVATAICDKTATCAKQFFAALTLPVTLPLALIGIVPRFAGTILQTEPFRYYKSEVREKTPSDFVTLVSWNISAMHGPVPTILDNLIPWKDRMDKLLGLVRGQDIIALQEVHDEDCADALIAGLKGEYRHFYYNIGQRAIGHNSGLFIASKVPLAKPRFELYTPKAGNQRFVNKGYFTVRVHGGFDLVVTHMQPRTQPEDVEARKGQWAQLYRSLSSDCSSIICGDLNTEKGGDGYSDTIAPYNRGDDTPTCQERGETTPTKILDYILEVQQGGQSLQATAQVIDGNGLSDHQPLLAQISL